jgi:cyclophilin family peptidyl-prolyl cis-trans isomerase
MMKSNRRRPSTGYRPRIEILEDRCVPADFSGSISGTAFVDRNANGRFDVGREAALKGAPVKLVGRTTQNVAVNVLVRADAAGKYRFDNVMPGSYRVAGSPISGRLPGPAVRVVLTPGQNVSRNVAFGAVRPGGVNLRQLMNNSPPGSIPGTGGAGSGVAKAAVRPDSKPLTNGTLADVTIAKNKATDTFVDMAAFFKDPDTTHTMVRFKTTAGNINVELFDNEAPQTVANFLNYITSNKYDNTVFHRLATGFVLQAGGFTYNEDLRTITEIADLPPVKNEPGTFTGSDPLISRSNLQGTLAMAKIPAVDGNNVPIPGGGPDSATNQFFFNLANNASNLDTQNGGFTVFGKIVGTADQTVLNALAAFTPTNRSSFNSAFDTFPLKNYTGTNFPTDVTPANLAMITDVEVVKRDEQLTFTVVNNTNPGLFDVANNANDGALAFVNNQLKIKPAKDVTGTAAITIRATDKFGATVERTFNVIVGNDAPTASLTLTPASVNNTDTLTASVTAADPNGDAVSVKYEWTLTRGSATPVVIQSATKDGTSTSDVLDLSTVSGGVLPGDVITVKATPNDGTVDGTAATASRTVGDRLPTITDVEFTNGEIGVDGTLTVAATGTDPDGSTVTFDYEWTYGTTVVKTTTDGTGTDSLDLTTLDTLFPSIDRQTGDVVTVKVTPKANGASGSFSTVQFTVDRTPTVDGDGIANQVFSDPGTFQFDTSGDFSDPDNDTLTFTATLANGDALPLWLTMAADGTLSGDPGPTDEAVLSVKVTATDPVGKFVTSTFTLTVNNDAPTLTSVTPTPDTATPVSAAATLQADVVAADVNGDTITVNYTWTTRGGTIVLQNTNLSGTSTSNTLDLNAVSGLVPGGFLTNDIITLTVTPTDGTNTGSSATEAWTIA